MLEIVGSCNQRVFGLEPAERLRRQLREQNRFRLKRQQVPMGLAATACAILDEAAIAWLFEHPGELLGTPDGRPLAVAMPHDRLVEARDLLEGGNRAVPSGSKRFVRKLRRKVEMLALSIDDTPASRIERRLYVNAYKGVTDLVTKYVWPWPAYFVTRACARLGIVPNAVTVAGILLMLLATWLFWVGNFGGGLAAAWAMTFLDTVDGKLARVTGKASKFGNLLDHGTDILHPPLWWLAVTRGAAALDPRNAVTLWLCFGVIFVAYILSRWVEEGFKRRFGFNAFIWKPVDSWFRLIVARRNTILLMLTAGLLLDRLTDSWIAVAVWSVVSLLIQAVRLLMAERANRQETLRPWLA